MELGGKLLNSLRFKTQFLKRLQIVSAVDGATHTQEDDVESNGCSLENVAEIFVLLLCAEIFVLLPINQLGLVLLCSAGSKIYVMQYSCRSVICLVSEKSFFYSKEFAILSMATLMFTLRWAADPAMPDSPTFVASNYPQCRPFGS
jgi:hypothetical protein